MLSPIITFRQTNPTAPAAALSLLSRKNLLQAAASFRYPAAPAPAVVRTPAQPAAAWQLLFPPSLQELAQVSQMAACLHLPQQTLLQLSLQELRPKLSAQASLPDTWTMHFRKNRCDTRTAVPAPASHPAARRYKTDCRRKQALRLSFLQSSPALSDAPHSALFAQKAPRRYVPSPQALPPLSQERLPE